MYNNEPIRTTGGPSFDERVRNDEAQRNLNPYGEPIRTTGGPSFDERVRNDEAQRNLNPYGEPIRTTGGPSFDERVRNDEAQRNLNPYGEPIRTTGGPSFDERVRNDEAQRNLNPYGEPIRTTGGPSFDEIVRNDEAQRNLNPYGEPIRTTGGPSFDERVRNDEAQRNLNPYGEPIRTTGGPSFDERARNDEAQRYASIARDSEKVVILQKLINEFPANRSDLTTILESLDYRLDFIKKIVEGYRDQFVEFASKFKGNYSQDASDLINNKLAEYMCLIETLKTSGYCDLNELDLQLYEIMDIMHVRRKNGADVDIIFPVNYNFQDQEYQTKGDAVTIINGVNEHLKNNPYMAAIWKNAGYTGEEKQRTM